VKTWFLAFVAAMPRSLPGFVNSDSETVVAAGAFKGRRKIVGSQAFSRRETKKKLAVAGGFCYDIRIAPNGIQFFKSEIPKVKLKC